MSWWTRMNNAIRAGIRSYLQIQEANPRGITIRELLDYEGNAIKNRIWYRGDSYELSQLYEQISSGADSMKFWAAKASPGQEIRKIHTGVPALIVDTLASLSIADMDIAIEGDQTAEELFEEMSDDNDLTKEILTAVKESLYIGDGAFKITFDTDISEYPIVEFYPGDRIELDIRRKRIREVIFKTEFDGAYTGYVLKEQPVCTRNSMDVRPKSHDNGCHEYIKPSPFHFLYQLVVIGQSPFCYSQYKRLQAA